MNLVYLFLPHEATKRTDKLTVCIYSKRQLGPDYAEVNILVARLQIASFTRLKDVLYWVIWCRLRND
jgi:hypothetical protein